MKRFISGNTLFSASTRTPAPGAFAIAAALLRGLLLRPART
jgi:hypothetical protein